MVYLSHLPGYTSGYITLSVPGYTSGCVRLSVPGYTQGVYKVTYPGIPQDGEGYLPGVYLRVYYWVYASLCTLGVLLGICLPVYLRREVYAQSGPPSLG